MMRFLIIPAIIFSLNIYSQFDLGIWSGVRFKSFSGGIECTWPVINSRVRGILSGGYYNEHMWSDSPTYYRAIPITLSIGYSFLETWSITPFAGLGAAFESYSYYVLDYGQFYITPDTPLERVQEKFLGYTYGLRVQKNSPGLSGLYFGLDFAGKFADRGYRDPISGVRIGYKFIK